MKFYNYTIKEKKETTHNVFALKLAPQDGGQVFDYKPGQYVMIGIKNENGEVDEKRAFSLASSPTNKDYIELGFKIYGPFTQKTASLKEGDGIAVSEPTGTFTFSENRSTGSMMLAGGIGVTPLMSMIRYACDKKLPNKITLLYSNKTENDIVYYNEFKKLSEENSNFRVIFTITDDISADWQGERGRIDKEMIKKYAGSLSSDHFLLCGPPGFMEATINNLKELGVSEMQIEMEKF